MDVRLQGVAVQPLVAQPDARVVVALLAQSLDLPGRAGDVELAGTLPAAVDALAHDRLPDLVEILAAELDEPPLLAREQRGALGHAVRERGHADAAVAPAGLPAGGPGLEDDDVEAGVLLLGEERRPEAGEAGADHGEVAGDAAGQRRPRGRRLRRVKPERRRPGVPQRAQGPCGSVCGCAWCEHGTILRASSHPSLGARQRARQRVDQERADIRPPAVRIEQVSSLASRAGG